MRTHNTANYVYPYVDELTLTAENDPGGEGNTTAKYDQKEGNDSEDTPEGDSNDDDPEEVMTQLYLPKVPKEPDKMECQSLNDTI